MEQQTGGSHSNDENTNHSTGKKRQQMQSPFSAATPKSRIGKEPKRILKGSSPLANTNKADSNLEDTCIEAPTPVRDITSVSELSYLSNTSSVVDPNLEQTAIIEQTSIVDYSSSTDLSMVAEEDTSQSLSFVFEEKVSIQDESGQKTPTPSTPKTPKPTVDDIFDQPTPTAPTVLASQLRLDNVSDSTASPMCISKPVVDQSMHEFLMLEQKVEYDCSNDELRERVEKLQLQIQEINAARVFEEKALMQQTEAVSKKAKADRAAAQKKIDDLEVKVNELEEKLKVGGDDSSKKQLEEQLADLTGRIEELTKKALNVEELQQEMLRYKTEIDQLKEKNEKLQVQVAEGGEMAAKASESEARVTELEQDREELRQMMIQEMSTLENQLDETREKLRKAEESAQQQATAEDHSQKIAEMDSKIEKLEKEILEFETLSAKHEEQLAENRKVHQAEMDELRAKFEAQIANQESELRAALANTQDVLAQLDALRAESVKSAEKVEKSNSELEAARTKIDELTSELADSKQLIDNIWTETNFAAEDVQKRHEQQIQELKKQFSEKISSDNSEVEMLGGEIVTLEQQLEAAKTEAAANEDQLNSQIVELKKQLDEVPLLKNKIEELTTKMSNLTSECNEQILRSETDIYEKYMAQTKLHDEEMAELKENYENQVKKNSELRLTLTGRNSEVEVVRNNLEEKMAEMTRKHKDEVAKLQHQMEGDNAKHLAGHAGLILSYKNEIENLTDKLTAAQSSQQMIMSLGNFESCEDAVMNIKKMADGLKEEIDSITAGHKVEKVEMEEKLKVAGDEITRMQELFMFSEEESKEKFNALQEKYEAALLLKVELEEARAQIETLTEEASTFHLQMDEFQKNYDSAEKLENETKEELAKTRAVLEEEKQRMASRDADLEQEHQLLEQQLKLQTTSIAALEQELIRVQGQLELRQSEVEAQQELNRKVSTLTEELSFAQETIASLSSEIESARTQSTDDWAAKEAAYREEVELIRQQLEEASVNKQTLSDSVDAMTAERDAVQQRFEECRAELESARQQLEEASSNKNTLSDNVDAMTAERDAAQKLFEECHAQLEAALQQTTNDWAAKEAAYREEVELIRQQLEEASVNKQTLSDNVDAMAVERDTAQQRFEECRAQLEAVEKEMQEMRSDDHELEALNARIVELESALKTRREELDEVKSALEKKTSELESALTEVSTSRDVVANYEKEMVALTSNATNNSQIQEQLLSANATISELNEKLEAAEQIMANKETAIVTLESRMETMSQQFEQRLDEASQWRTQAQSIEVLTSTIQSMQTQLKDMSAQLEASNRRVIEVEATAQHDITIAKEESGEHEAQLAAARLRIAELEEQLGRMKREVERLEKVCDEFDEDEAKMKGKIRELELELKQMKGIKSPPKVMGLIQQARKGIKPLSRESSQIEQPKDQEDSFEDASESFAGGQTLQKTMAQNVTVAQTNSPNVTMHPDDSQIGTPSKKKGNRSNCQQQ